MLSEIPPGTSECCKTAENNENEAGRARSRERKRGDGGMDNGIRGITAKA
jgi:hypothetical protein